MRNSHAQIVALLAILLPTILGGTEGCAREDFLLWIEAEGFSQATNGISTVETTHVHLSQDEKRGASYWLRTSGRAEEAAGKVSGRGYVERTTDGPEREYSEYEFTLPDDGDYYIWLRVNTPPPCFAPLCIWFDSLDRQTEAERTELRLGVWGVWVWWGLGQTKNDAAPKPYRLSAGRHRLFVGDMSKGFRLDKILITDSSRYVPVGTSERYYTSTFSPPSWPTASHGWANSVRATDTGWLPAPREDWSVIEDPLSGNYVYNVAPVSSGTLAFSLIDKFWPDTFVSRFTLLPQSIKPGERQNALFLFGWMDPANYEAVRLCEHSMELLSVRNGSERLLYSVVASMEANKEPHKLCVQRTPVCLDVTMDSKKAISVRLPYPVAGAVGLGTTTGAVAFDDVEVSPLNDPAASFDFRDKTDPCLADWVCLRGEKEKAWSPSDELEKGDLLAYQAPPWANSEVLLSLENTNWIDFSVLFPFTDSTHFLETHLTRGKGSRDRIELIRHNEGRVTVLGSFAVSSEAKPMADVLLQCVKGSIAVFLGGERILEANEYEMVSGTIVFQMGSNCATCPVRTVNISKCNMIVDNFPLTASGALDEMWDTPSGHWKVVPVLDSQVGGADGQLTVHEKGTALLGKDTWRSYLLEVSSLIDESTKVALLCLQSRGDDSAFEFVVHCGEVRIQKVVSGNALLLAARSLPDLRPGWHRLALAAYDDSLVAEVDDTECLRVHVPPGTGRAGLRSYGEYAVFDDLTVHVLSEDAEREADIQNVDPLFKTIEESMRP